MPRKNRRDPAFFEPPDAAGVPVTRSDAPMWAQAPGYEIRNVGGQKAYRCPGCDHQVPQARRHWHTECWRKELRRLGLYRPPASEE